MPTDFFINACYHLLHNNVQLILFHILYNNSTNNGICLAPLTKGTCIDLPTAELSKEQKF